MITAKDLDERQKNMLQVFNEGLPDTLYKNHYDLAALTRELDYGETSPDEWRELLEHPEVSIQVRNEIKVLQTHERNNMVRDLHKQRNQVGMAAMLTAVNKLIETENEVNGNIFIYSGVPLNESEIKLMEADKDE